jgi:AraC family transcriptional regulator of adaptative response / DNA-3-methyladenine glycosylase II
MADVALAAGFGSVRRFNEAFQRVHRRPPSAIRRAGGAAPGGAAAPIVLSLATRAPYDSAALLDFLRARAIPGVEVVEAARVRRAVRVGDAVGTVAIEPEPNGRALRATVRFPRLAALPAVIATIRRVFDLDADPAAIGAHLAADPALAPLVASRPGLRVPGAWDGFELAVRAILGQQVTVAAATRLAARLVAAYGEPLAPDVAEPGLTHAFPRPERLAHADVAALGMPRARGAAIAALAAEALRNPDLFAPGPDLEASLARLCTLPGVGPWTAQVIALRALREPDAFPAADVGLLRRSSRGPRRGGRGARTRCCTSGPRTRNAAKRLRVRSREGAVAAPPSAASR